MSDPILSYPSNSRIAARLTFAPADTAPVGFILLRDGHNQVQRRFQLCEYQPDTWLDITRDVVLMESGFVEAALVRTTGNGPWSATLHLRATASPGTSEASNTEHGKHNHVAPSVLFRNII
jgi:hypothetical protein